MQHAKLWKRILNENIKCRGFRFIDGEDLRSVIIESPIIVAPDVDPQETEGETFDWKRRSGLSVPFPVFWLEMQYIHKDASVLCGYSITTHKKEDRFIVHVVELVGLSGVPVFVSMQTAFCLRLNGDLIVKENGDFELAITEVDEFVTRNIGAEKAKTQVFTSVDYVAGIMQIIGAKNVGLQENPIESTSASRAAKRCGGNPEDYRYRTLVVRPAGAGPHVKGEPLGIMPRHVCRGHFAEYGPDFGKGLLFGKHAGRFYVPPHVKGDKKNGVVEKDYMVKPTAQASVEAEGARTDPA